MIAAIVGPSGAGKDTLIAGALAARPGLRRLRRTITRPAEAGGEEFDAATPEAFRALADQGAFALTWQAHGLSYGIPRAELAPGGDMIFNGSREALPAALAAFPELRVILVTAPPELLARRLAARGREAGPDIAERLARASYALPAGIAATTVMNDASREAGVARLLAALE